MWLGWDLVNSCSLTLAQDGGILRVSAVACTTPPVLAGGDVQLGPLAANIIKVNWTNTFSKQRSTYANGILESVWVGVLVSMCIII